MKGTKVQITFSVIVLVLLASIIHLVLGCSWAFTAAYFAKRMSLFILGFAALFFFSPYLQVLKKPKCICDRKRRAIKLAEKNNKGMVLTAEESIELEEFIEEGVIKIFHEVAAGGDMERFQAKLSDKALEY